MDFSRLHEKYGGFRRPTFALTVDGVRLDSGPGVSIETLECRLTARRQAGSLCLAADLIPGSALGGTWLAAVQPGAVCSLALGYQEIHETVFSGFVYDVAWGDPLDAGVERLELVCLDVRGQLMLSACPDAGAARSLSQLARAILNQPACTRMASDVRLGRIPEDWDLPFQRAGATDFAVLCAAADFLCLEFYAFGGTVYFGPARPSSETAVAFSGPNGLLELRRRRSLSGQCAAAAVSGADDRGERLYARAERSPDRGFGSARMGAALVRDLHQAEPALRTMAQANHLAQVRMEARQRRGGGLAGRGTGLPELRPGRFVEVSGLSEPVNGTYYVQSVTHTIDETGFETAFEAEE